MTTLTDAEKVTENSYWHCSTCGIAGTHSWSECAKHGAMVFGVYKSVGFRDLLREPEWISIGAFSYWLRTAIGSASVTRCQFRDKWNYSIGCNVCDEEFDTADAAKSAAWDHIVSRIAPAFK